MIDILGSCTSRDTMNFIQMEVGKYHARQSIMSVMSPPPKDAEIANLRIDPDAHQFHQTAIRNDFQKNTLTQIKESKLPLVIDLIEERTPIGVMPSGAFVSLSQAADKFSNAHDLIERKIAAFSPEHIIHMKLAIELLSDQLRGKKVIVHRAMYAAGDWPYEHANIALETLYDALSEILPCCRVVNVGLAHRNADPCHKWGHGPFHYTDDYYQIVASGIKSELGLTCSMRNATMQVS